MKVKNKYEYDYKIVSFKLTNAEFNAFQKIINEFNFNRSKLLKQLVANFIHNYQSEKNFNKKNKNLTSLKKLL